MSELKLHLGCGDRHIEGFVNIDIRYLPTVDVVDNIRFLRRYESGSVDLIYASHVLEHFSRWDYIAVLQRWHELLKDSGVLRIAVPDFNAIAQYYIKTRDLKSLRGLLYGGQDYDENYHYCCWDFKILNDDLKKAGFKSASFYNWRNTEHAHVDDCSQAYIPHMDKENGQLMSLNVEAIK